MAAEICFWKMDGNQPSECRSACLVGSDAPKAMYMGGPKDDEDNGLFVLVYRDTVDLILAKETLEPQPMSGQNVPNFHIREKLLAITTGERRLFDWLDEESKPIVISIANTGPSIPNYDMN